MNVLKLLVRHAAIGVVSLWGVFTAVFVLFWIVVDDQSAFGVPEATDASMAELYVVLLRRTSTLQWGVATGGDPERSTFAYYPGDPVISTVLDAVLRTALYLVPAVILGIGVAVLVGLCAALLPNSRIVSASLGTTYLLYGIPSFWLGAIVLSFAIGQRVPYSPVVFEHLLPIVLVATTLAGAAVSYVRAYAVEYKAKQFVRAVESRGAGSVRLAVHILRNAAIPVVSMLFTEAFALLVLSVIVIEIVFAIDGIGLVVYGAANSGDLPVLLGAVLTIVVAGVVANVLQDLSYGILDPRVGDAQ